jgi:antitoxin HicB
MSKMNVWTYGATIKKEQGDFVVSVRDLPEVVTSGSSLDEALELAADAIEVAVAGRMQDDMELPLPSSPRKGEYRVALPPQLSAKASVYSAWKAARLSKVELAKLLDRNEAEVRRILNPRHGTKLDQLEEAARALGGRLVVGFERETSP